MECRFNGCDRPGYGRKDVCASHYAQLRRGGELRPLGQPRPRKPVPAWVPVIPEGVDMSGAPVHESRARGVYYEVPGDGGSAIVWCNCAHTSLHVSPTGWYCHTEEEAKASAEQHARDHANVPDPVLQEDTMIARPMPAQAYLSEADAEVYRHINRKKRGSQYPDDVRDEAEALFAQGLGYRKVAARLGISQWTVKTWAEQWQAVA